MFHVIMGLPGTGKTTAALYLANKFCPENFHLSYLGSDFVENRLFAMQGPPKTSQERARRRHAASSQIAHLIRAGYGKNPIVDRVIDGAFRTRAERAQMLSDIILNRWSYSILLITARKEIARDRVAARHAARISRCTVKDYEIARSQFEEIKQPYRIIDNSGSMHALHAALDDYLSNFP